MSRLEQLGTKISQCRQNKNMTQEELARRLGITPQALSKWERNLSYPDIMKNLTDNLQMAYPALVEGVVPEKLSYGLLTEVVRGLLQRGYYMVCLPKIIEYLDSAFRENSEADTSELIDMVQEKLKAFYS
ncbi:MAG: helix-turn-helix domain-containing protein [Lachnospiraceae bacterium]|nr:helix-turn-helix domain-containing protein [Lachnospiraceae bacterium]